MDIQRATEILIKHTENSDRVYFKRKIKELEELVDITNEIGIKISELQIKQQPYLDKISAIRQDIAPRCVHPKDYLKHVEANHFICTFCDVELNFNE